jgi:beta-barrel assembly-enhancing protease
MRSLLVLGTACVVWAQMERPVGKGVNFYSIEKERALGKQLAAEVEKDTHRVDDPVLTGRVESLGKRILDYLPGEWREFEFFVIEENRRVTREPLALPGGYIFVSRALIDAARDDSELAAMIAHAMAHVAARHGTRMATRGQIANIGTIPLTFIGGWADLGGEDGAMPRGLFPYIRASELEADRIAIETIARAGFDRGALVRYLERLPDAKHPSNFSPMPSKAERIEALSRIQ